MSRTQIAKVTMYRTRGCPFCIAAESFLEARGVEFDQVYLDDHPDRWKFTSEILPGHETVPLILIGDDPLGGYTDLRDLDQKDQLEPRIFGG